MALDPDMRKELQSGFSSITSAITSLSDITRTLVNATAQNAKDTRESFDKSFSKYGGHKGGGRDRDSYYSSKAALDEITGLLSSLGTTFNEYRDTILANRITRDELTKSTSAVSSAVIKSGRMMLISLKSATDTFMSLRKDFLSTNKNIRNLGRSIASAMSSSTVVSEDDSVDSVIADLANTMASAAALFKTGDTSKIYNSFDLLIRISKNSSQSLKSTLSTVAEVDKYFRGKFSENLWDALGQNQADLFLLAGGNAAEFERLQKEFSVAFQASSKYGTQDLLQKMLSSSDGFFSVLSDNAAWLSKYTATLTQQFESRDIMGLGETLALASRDFISSVTTMSNSMVGRQSLYSVMKGSLMPTMEALSEAAGNSTETIESTFGRLRKSLNASGFEEAVGEVEGTNRTLIENIQFVTQGFINRLTTISKVLSPAINAFLGVMNAVTGFNRFMQTLQKIFDKSDEDWERSKSSVKDTTNKIFGAVTTPLGIIAKGVLPIANILTGGLFPTLAHNAGVMADALGEGKTWAEAIREFSADRKLMKQGKVDKVELTDANAKAILDAIEQSNKGDDAYKRRRDAVITALSGIPEFKDVDIQRLIERSGVVQEAMAKNIEVKERSFNDVILEFIGKTGDFLSEYIESPLFSIYTLLQSWYKESTSKDYFGGFGGPYIGPHSTSVDTNTGTFVVNSNDARSNPIITAVRDELSAGVDTFMNRTEAGSSLFTGSIGSAFSTAIGNRVDAMSASRQKKLLDDLKAQGITVDPSKSFHDRLIEAIEKAAFASEEAKESLENLVLNSQGSSGSFNANAAADQAMSAVGAGGQAGFSSGFNAAYHDAGGHWYNPSHVIRGIGAGIGADMSMRWGMAKTGFSKFLSQYQEKDEEGNVTGTSAKSVFKGVGKNIGNTLRAVGGLSLVSDLFGQSMAKSKNGAKFQQIFQYASMGAQFGIWGIIGGAVLGMLMTNEKFKKLLSPDGAIGKALSQLFDALMKLVDALMPIVTAIANIIMPIITTVADIVVTIVTVLSDTVGWLASKLTGKEANFNASKEAWSGMWSNNEGIRAYGRSDYWQNITSDSSVPENAAGGVISASDGIPIKNGKDNILVSAQTGETILPRGVSVAQYSPDSMTKQTEALETISDVMSDPADNLGISDIAGQVKDVIKQLSNDGSFISSFGVLLGKGFIAGVAYLLNAFRRPSTWLMLVDQFTDSFKEVLPDKLKDKNQSTNNDTNGEHSKNSGKTVWDEVKRPLLFSALSGLTGPFAPLANYLLNSYFAGKDNDTSVEGQAQFNGGLLSRGRALHLRRHFAGGRLGTDSMGRVILPYSNGQDNLMFSGRSGETVLDLNDKRTMENQFFNYNKWQRRQSPTKLFLEDWFEEIIKAVQNSGSGGMGADGAGTFGVGGAITDDVIKQFIKHYQPNMSDADLQEWLTALRPAQEAFGKNFGFVLGQIAQESRFDKSARSGAGASGGFQFIKSTADALGIDRNNLIDAGKGYVKLNQENVQRMYKAGLLNSDKLSELDVNSMAILARGYNANPANVIKNKGMGVSNENRAYVPKIYEHMGYLADLMGISVDDLKAGNIALNTEELGKNTDATNKLSDKFSDLFIEIADLNSGVLKVITNFNEDPSKWQSFDLKRTDHGNYSFVDSSGNTWYTNAATDISGVTKLYDKNGAQVNGVTFRGVSRDAQKSKSYLQYANNRRLGAFPEIPSNEERTKDLFGDGNATGGVITAADGIPIKNGKDDILVSAQTGETILPRGFSLDALIAKKLLPQHANGTDDLNSPYENGTLKNIFWNGFKSIVRSISDDSELNRQALKAIADGMQEFWRVNVGKQIDKIIDQLPNIDKAIDKLFGNKSILGINIGGLAGGLLKGLVKDLGINDIIGSAGNALYSLANGDFDGFNKHIEEAGELLGGLFGGKKKSDTVVEDKRVEGEPSEDLTLKKREPLTMEEQVRIQAAGAANNPSSQSTDYSSFEGALSDFTQKLGDWNPKIGVDVKVVDGKVSDVNVYQDTLGIGNG